MENSLFKEMIIMPFCKRKHGLYRLCMVVFLCMLSVMVLKSQNNYEQLPYFDGFEKKTGWELNVGPNGRNAENRWFVSDMETFMGDLMK